MKIKICIETGCKNVQTTKDYCRLHYVKNWKRIRETLQKKAADRLNKYVEGICKKFPEKYMDNIRKDIRKEPSGSEKPIDEMFSGDAVEGLVDELGFKDDDSLGKLISHIKIDKDF